MTALTTDRLDCHVEIVRGNLHTQQLLAGFLILAARRAIRLRVTVLPASPERWPFIVTVTVNGHVRLGYDLQDEVITLHTNTERYIDSLKYFFARSYRPGSYGQYEDRVRPLGLNYDVTVLHPVALRARFSSLSSAARFSAKFGLCYEQLPLQSVFEQRPSRSDNGSVLFMTRVWTPDEGDHPDAVSATARLNDERADYVRTLRNAFGNRFVGGLHPTPYAREHYADCLAPRKLTYKRRYIGLMKEAAVCVTSPGLGRSNGWKLAEFVASSKAIVAPPLYHVVPGDFRPGLNFLAASSVSEVVPAVRQLLDDDDLRSHLAIANHKYYSEMVRPDAFVARTLVQVVEGTSSGRTSGPRSAARSVS
jgi:hypothetical protein